MAHVAWLWIPFTIVAAVGQVARNAMQRQLTGPLGTLGATNIRFLFGFPFSLVFFAIVIAVTGDRLSWSDAGFWPWLLLGALSQIVATGLMLAAMNDRSFVVTTAYLKTEAIQTAVFGFAFLGDRLTVVKVIAILIATVGVIVTALRPGGTKGFGSLKPTILGLVAAAFFEAGRFAGPLAEEVQFCTPDRAAAFDFDLGDPGRMNRELALDALVGHDPTDRERLAAAGAGAGDHRAGEDLDPLLVAFQNLGVHVHDVADVEIGDFRLETRLFN